MTFRSCPNLSYWPGRFRPLDLRFSSIEITSAESSLSPSCSSTATGKGGASARASVLAPCRFRRYSAVWSWNIPQPIRLVH